MVVFNTEMHVVTFLVVSLEIVFLFNQIISYLSRPSDKNRLYYLILLYLLIQHNIVGGLFPDENIPIPIMFQNILAYAVAFSMGMYFPYYFYKAFNLTKLRFYAYWGSVAFLLGPFILCFIVPYFLTNDFILSRRLAVIIPFLYALSFLYSLTRSIKIRNKENKDAESRKEIFGMYISVILFVLLPIITFFQSEINTLLEPVIHFYNGSQIVEVVVVNSGLLAITILFLRKTVRQSREEYDKLQASEKELIIKVKERTQELELVNSQRTNAFINLAHETKTPLTLANNYIDEIISKYGDCEEINILKSCIANLTKDIVNVFDTERIKKGFNLYNHNQISPFSRIIQESVVLFQKFSARKNIQISATIENDLFVEADPNSLYRIVNNIVSNAIRYTDNGGKIEITLRSVGENIEFSVKDNGIGIPANLHDKIFEPYYQISSEKANFEGIGLGLSIVKKITDSLEGKIILQSDPSKTLGTEITIQLLRYMHPVTDDQIPHEFQNNIESYFQIEQSKEKDEVFDDSKPVIMIVEDNIPVLNLMLHKFTEKYNVYLASSGIEAQNKLKAIKRLDLIVSDVMMDNGDGIDLYKYVSTQSQFAHVPFIFLTAKTMTKDKMHGLSLGAIDYIPKPFEIDVLISKIDSVLRILSLQRKSLIDNVYKLIPTNLSDHVDIQAPVPIPNLDAFEDNCKKFGLTTREKEIVMLIAKGQSYKLIAEGLHISPLTVSKHVQNSYEKVDVSNKVELLSKLGASIASAS